MSRVLVTGAAGGLGYGAASALLAAGHDVIVHARSAARLSDADDLIRAGATAVTGDLATLDDVWSIAQQSADSGPVDAVIHNAGVIDGPDMVAVNVVAPYALTAALPQAGRHIFLSSSMHRSGHPSIPDLKAPRRVSYSDTKLLVTVFSIALARLRSDLVAHAVDPGWVPTRMGGPGAPDDLAEGHRTQAWLAVTDDASALTSGSYWHHRRRQEPHPAAGDADFHTSLMTALADHTGAALTSEASGRRRQ